VNIAILCFHTIGGSGVVASELGRQLGRRGHRVHFVGAAQPERLHPLPAGVSFHAVPLEEPPPVGRQGFVVSLAARLIEVVRAERIDIVHVHYAVPHAAAAMLARATGWTPRLVLTLHGSDVPQESASEGRVLLARRMALEADAVTTPSEALAARARERLGLDDSVMVVPNFIDTDRFTPSGERASLPSGPVLMHASNFRPVKRVTDVVRIFARVRATRPATLVLVGDGPDRAAVEAEVAAHGLARDVIFTGFVHDVAPLFRAATLFFMPSQLESFGMATAEAMACGVPVLASKVGGLPEVVGEAGVLAHVGDVEAFAVAALRLLDDGAARERLGLAARERAVRLFQPAPVLARWEEIYRRLLRP